eukprot:Gb_24231 [translate_table: standard]
MHCLPFEGPKRSSEEILIWLRARRKATLPLLEDGDSSVSLGCFLFAFLVALWLQFCVGCLSLCFFNALDGWFIDAPDGWWAALPMRRRWVFVVASSWVVSQCWEFGYLPVWIVVVLSICLVRPSSREVPRPSDGVLLRMPGLRIGSLCPIAPKFVAWYQSTLIPEVVSMVEWFGCSFVAMKKACR